MQMIIGDYYEQLYSNKFDNLGEMDMYTLPRLYHEEKGALKD
jgi:hypothetical protein